MEPQTVVAYLKRIPGLADLDETGEQELLRLVPHVEERIYQSGDTLLHHWEASAWTLVIVEGQVSVQRIEETSEGTKLLTTEVGEGEVLGRWGLQIAAFEPVTATALTDVTCLRVAFRDLVRVYDRSPYLREHLDGPLRPAYLVSILRSLPLFQNLDDRAGELELRQVANLAHDQYYEDGEWLFRQGEVSDRLIYVVSGLVELTAVTPEGYTHKLGTLTAGQYAGETGLLIGDFHDATATARGYARVIYLLREEFHSLLERRPYLERRLHMSPEVARRYRLRTFDWLRDDEWVVSVVQRHWSRLFLQTWNLVLLILLLTPLVVSLLSSGTRLLIIVGAILCLPLLGLILAAVWRYINWRDDFFVVTTQRVVHIERTGPFNAQHEETPLDNIQDIYEVQPGFMANLLNYGNLVLQTAGETVEIDMSYVPAPDALRRLISEQMERIRARNVLRTRGQIRELLARRLQRLDISAEESYQAEEETEADSSRPGGALFTIWAAIREFLFPPSWVVSGDGSTVIWRRFWLPGFIRTLPIFLGFVVASVGGGVLLSRTVAREGFPLWTFAWLLLEIGLLSALLWMLEDWRNDYFQLTPTHVILVERLPMLLRESRHEARLDRIQNLSYEIPSLTARLLKYGHVQFETAGTEGKFQLQYVRHPAKVQITISNRQHQYRQKQQQMEAQRHQEELLTWFSSYDSLRHT